MKDIFSWIISLFSGSGSGFLSSGILVAILFGGGVYLWNLNSEISRLKIELLQKERVLEAKRIALQTQEDNVRELQRGINAQNEALKAMELRLMDTQTKQEIKEKIITKYQKIYLKENDPTCEAELNQIKEVVKAFYE